MRSILSEYFQLNTISEIINCESGSEIKGCDKKWNVFDLSATRASDQLSIKQSIGYWQLQARTPACPVNVESVEVDATDQSKCTGSLNESLIYVNSLLAAVHLADKSLFICLLLNESARQPIEP